MENFRHLVFTCTPQGVKCLQCTKLYRHCCEGRVTCLRAKGSYSLLMSQKRSGSISHRSNEWKTHMMLRQAPTRRRCREVRRYGWSIRAHYPTHLSFVAPDDQASGHLLWSRCWSRITTQTPAPRCTDLRRPFQLLAVLMLVKPRGLGHFSIDSLISEQWLHGPVPVINISHRPYVLRWTLQGSCGLPFETDWQAVGEMLLLPLANL